MGEVVGGGKARKKQQLVRVLTESDALSDVDMLTPTSSNAGETSHRRGKGHGKGKQ